MDTLKPWEEKGSPYPTKAKYFSFIRSNLRSMWKGYRLKTEFTQARRFAKVIGTLKTGPKAGQPKTQWYAECDQCRCETPCTNMQVDHITPAGSLKEYSDASGFIERMLCSTKGMQYLCIPCHQVITHAEKKGFSLEVAEIDLQAIKYMKMDTSDQIKMLLPFSAYAEISNAKKRKERFFDLIAKELL